MLAKLWEPAGDSAVRCLLCAHSCTMKEGRAGICGVRLNHKGELATLVGDIATAINLDPVEKKPLYHFLPGTRTFSVGSAGCNFRCRFCQNSEIAHVGPKSRVTGRRVTPESLVRVAMENHAPSISFTYNEPTVFFEQMYETAGLAKERGLRTILVSNGFMGETFLKTMARRLDAANIDLKGFTDEFYRHYCGGRLEPVLNNLRAIKRLGWWLEVTTLLIPGVNDSPAEINQIATFIRDELGVDTPWHVSGFHGAAEMIAHPSTPLAKLEEAWQIGHDAGLEYVYIGNAPSLRGENTVCPECGKLLVERHGYRTKVMFKDGICPVCQRNIAGIWN